jgi:integrase
MTLRGWGEEWLTMRHDTMRPTTRVRHASMFRLHVLDDVIGDLELADLDRRTMVDYMARLAHKPSGRGSPLSPKTRAHIYKSLHACLSDAVAEGLLDRNPLDRIPMPRQHTPEQPCYSISEAQTIIDRRSEHRWGWVYALAVLTGMRRGELCGLTWDDVDLANACLYVRHTRSTAGHTIVEDEPKTRHGKRRIDLPEIAVDILNDTIQARDTARAEWGNDWNPAGDHRLIVNEDGSLPHPDRVGDQFKAYCTLIRVTHHNLIACRHTFAALSLASGTSLEDLKVRMGHAQIATTLLYAHWYPGHGATAAAALAAVLGYGPPPS